MAVPWLVQTRQEPRPPHNIDSMHTFPNPTLRSAARSIASFTATAARHGSATGSASSFVGGHASDCRRDPGSPSYVSRLARGERRSREIEGLLDREISMILASVMKRKAMVRKNVAKG